MTKHCVAYYTHYVSASVRREVARLAAELPAEYDIWVFGCCENESMLDELGEGRIRAKTYTKDHLKLIPYSAKVANANWLTLRQNNDLAPMNFFRDFPDYDYYWFIEYDVRYTGKWEELFKELTESQADLLCTHLCTFAQSPVWMHWDSLKAPTPTEAVNSRDQLRGFLPFCRASSKLLKLIDIRCQHDWQGHYEVLWPTIANLEKLLVEDIGGRSTFTPEIRKGRYYHSAYIDSLIFLSTFGAWPFYSEKSVFSATSSTQKNILWHPVKE